MGLLPVRLTPGLRGNPHRTMFTMPKVLPLERRGLTGLPDVGLVDEKGVVGFCLRLGQCRPAHFRLNTLDPFSDFGVTTTTGECLDAIVPAAPRAVRRTPRAVSYTHLTLPTKRIV